MTPRARKNADIDLRSATATGAALNVTGETIRRWYRQGIIPGITCDRTLRFDIDAVVAALAARKK